ncbi:DUF6392 family protein [Pseudomonas chlororaphis]|uniref:DUF6392 family protein n=1 Tax=Pseudomonas chlororaphis TaxID=587753 RepID=UPI0003D2F32B|nr:DUF6392 family protein [Pseudomonas chlororaphis]AZD29909.1 hypothetical protein C4K23_3160 [Pseudomonas chlororaphis]ETD39301.1 pyocin S3-immunity protein [Pseudomonas chlororaphis subsp. aurantiaca PB-St2]QFS55344.1 pyocin immunity protein [Pseudomonas chlororaphis subsp. aurantiaca]
MINDLIKSLGRTYPELIASGMYLPGGPPKGIFEDSETLSLVPESGLEIGFLASNLQFETLFISLLESFEGESTYKGKLPYEVESRMNQQWVRSRYGEPFSSRAPFKMPIRGMTGGSDTYRFSSIPKGTQVVFKYNADLDVKMVVFRLNEKSRA